MKEIYIVDLPLARWRIGANLAYTLIKLSFLTPRSSALFMLIETKKILYSLCVMNINTISK